MSEHSDDLAAGWYPDGAGAIRWWTGSAWTEHTTTPAPPAAAAPEVVEPVEPDDGRLLTFASHVAGKNATVVVYPDRVEWTRAGLMTLGRSSSEIIPIRSISSVSAKRGGLVRTVVQVVTTGGKSIDFHVGNRDVERVKTLLSELVLRA